jgi:hypothetical protein
MFEQILQLVKEHLGNNPQVASTIPAEKADAVHEEIATHITNGLQGQAAPSGGGGLLSNIVSSLGSGNLLTSALEGGLVSSLASKLGLPPAATGAIAAALPGLLQKVARKTGSAGI